MNSKPVQGGGFTLVGIEVRTSNAKEMSQNGVIPKQWDRFMKENLLEQIPNKVDGNIIAAYTDYHGKDGDLEYAFIIGAKVSTADSLPSGMTVRKAPSGKFVKFTSDQGPVWQVVPTIWKKICEELGWQFIRSL